jgi:hypothetical protein
MNDNDNGQLYHRVCLYLPADEKEEDLCQDWDAIGLFE